MVQQFLRDNRQAIAALSSSGDVVLTEFKRSTRHMHRYVRSARPVIVAAGLTSAVFGEALSAALTSQGSVVLKGYKTAGGFSKDAAVPFSKGRAMDGSLSLKGTEVRVGGKTSHVSKGDPEAARKNFHSQVDPEFLQEVESGEVDVVDSFLTDRHGGHRPIPEGSKAAGDLSAEEQVALLRSLAEGKK